MKIIPLVGTILERLRADNEREKAAKVEAIQEYNIMMGILEDPLEDDEDLEGEDDE